MAKYRVILGLGSNIGDRKAHLRLAISELAKHIENIKISSVYESKALLPENAPEGWDMPFYNMAISGDSSLTSQEILSLAKKIEGKLGRNKIGHWSPREIDIDMLAYGDMVTDEDNLSVPHKELLKRDFALVPLAEIEPDWLHPVVNKSAKELAKNFSDTELKKFKRTKIMGIINVTPDSFSDGGKNFSPDIAIENIKKLIREGADVIDIGAESTRPNATPISAQEEWQRLAPVLAHIKDFSVPISVDTRHPQTAKRALDLGASWINDVSGFSDPEMIEVVKNSDCKLVVMHSLTVPADKNIVLLDSCDVVEVISELTDLKIKELEKLGVKRERIIFDAGIGFGKTAKQSWDIVNNISRFNELGVEILVGHSRKSFMGSGASDDETIKVSHLLAGNGVDYLRVHNVYRHRLEIL